jgi:hypothetical protein
MYVSGASSRFSAGWEDAFSTNACGRCTTSQIQRTTSGTIQSALSENTDAFAGKPLAKDVVKSLMGMLEVAEWLLKQGVDPGRQDIYHRLLSSSRHVIFQSLTRF